MSAIMITAFLASAVAAAAPPPAPGPSEPQLQNASLHYVPLLASTGHTVEGIMSVDDQTLGVGQRINADVASGFRTVAYHCPNEAGISHLSFDFKSGQTYELVCRMGQQAEIRATEC